MQRDFSGAASFWAAYSSKVQFWVDVPIFDPTVPIFALIWNRSKIAPSTLARGYDSVIAAIRPTEIVVQQDGRRKLLQSRDKHYECNLFDCFVAVQWLGSLGHKLGNVQGPVLLRGRALIKLLAVVS